MIRLATITFALLGIAWVGIGLQANANLNEPGNEMVCTGTFLWIVAFGSCIAWKLLLIMIGCLRSALYREEEARRSGECLTSPRSPVP